MSITIDYDPSEPPRYAQRIICYVHNFHSRIELGMYQYEAYLKLK